MTATVEELEGRAAAYEQRARVRCQLFLGALGVLVGVALATTAEPTA